MTPKETLAQGFTEAAFREALQDIQWSASQEDGAYYGCPECGSKEEDGHAQDCFVGRVLSITPSKAKDQAKAFLEDVKIVNDMLWYPADGTNTEEDRFQAQLRIREKHLPALGYPSQWKGPTEYESGKG